MRSWYAICRDDPEKNGGHIAYAYLKTKVAKRKQVLYLQVSLNFAAAEMSVWDQDSINPN